MSYTPEPHHYVPFTDITVGHRCLHASKGSYVSVTVRAILPAPTPTDPCSSTSAARGNVVGIEYDDPSLEKHSGTLDGVQIFQTRREGAGSFVKYDDKRRKGLYRGWTVVEALMERYGVDIPSASSYNLAGQAVQGEDVEGQSAQEVTTGARLANGREIEMPNMASVARRVARLDKLQHAGLEGYHISGLAMPGQVINRAGLEDYLKGHLTSLTSLDMAGCLIHDWKGVAEVVRCFPVLEQVNLSHARIRLDDIAGDERYQPVRGIKVVMMNNCDLCPADVAHLTRLLPDLTRLDIPNNPSIISIPAVQHIDFTLRSSETSDMDVDSGAKAATDAEHGARRCGPTASRWERLKYLNVANTGLGEWDEVRRIVELCPLLETLDLSGIPIRSIPPPPLPLAHTTSNPASLPFRNLHHKNESSAVPAVSAGEGATDTVSRADSADAHLRLPNLIWNDCSLTSWSSIDHLRQWTGASITSMRYSFGSANTQTVATPTPTQIPARASSGLRLIGPDVTLNRALLIASLPSLLVLNGTAITSTERREAEMLYVRHVQQRHSAHASASDMGEGANKEAWGMYGELADRYGMADQMEMATLRGEGSDGSSGGTGGGGRATRGAAGALRSRLIALTIHCPLALSSLDSQSIPSPAISILPSTSIPLLRKKLAKVLHFPTADGVRLYTVRMAHRTDSLVEGEHAYPGTAGLQGMQEGEQRDKVEDMERIEQAAEVDGENVGYWFSDGDVIWVDL